MRPHFSHYSAITAEMVARYCARGNQPTDEMLLEAFERIDPPLLPPGETNAIIAIIGRQRGRRPKSAPSATALAWCVGASNRTDIPKRYLKELAARLAKRKGLTDLNVAMRFQKKMDKNVRNTLIRGLYRDFYELQDGKGFVRHPILGRIDGRKIAGSRSDRALDMTGTALRRMAFDPPSVRTMRNIISGR